ncbi:MAG: ATP-binding protein [Candidatus Pseudobacter hemicellulosilyticus]|uniref:histidine kinase n=1 Tax=Candidatus Pseudobacter hemicellulosilyticus TaxID=3121375 RepID=A0AAJ6BHV3_9BACT|nr:MAG: ATP-binding protein [Pseudobacter sp.]
MAVHPLKKRLIFITLVYWFLLLYIIAALIFWFTALDKQNAQMTTYRLNELKLDDPTYVSKYDTIQDERRRKSAQYTGEGLTFLAITLIVAVFVYRAVRRQIKLQQQQQNFMMAVTHELKTPIAVTRLNLETMQKRQLDEAQRQKLLSKTLEETNRLNTLTNNILVSAQLEGGRYGRSREPVDFSTLVSNCAQDFRNRFPERKMEQQVEPGLQLEGDPLLLQMLVNNLLENAIKYSAREGKITCKAYRQHHHLSLQVLDEGPGIPDNEKKKVFEKFYRIGNESTRTAKGTGLGLYLCKKIARDHKGTIHITDNSPVGCNFAVHIPA